MLVVIPLCNCCAKIHGFHLFIAEKKKKIAQAETQQLHPPTKKLPSNDK